MWQRVEEENTTWDYEYDENGLFTGVFCRVSDGKQCSVYEGSLLNTGMSDDALVITKDDADNLDELQEKQNSGRGVSCVRSMIRYIRMGRYDYAQNVWMIDGDKIRQYPEVEAKIIELFGCRLHGVKGCKKWLCDKDKGSE